MKKNILFVNDEMTMGGVARILNTLLKNLDQNKYNIDLLILHKRGELLEEIPSYVNVIAGSSFFRTIDIPLKECNLSNVLSKLRLLFYMKTGLIKQKIIKERKELLKEVYDIEFSAKEGFCTIFTAFGNSKRKLNWVQTDYKIHNFSINHMNLMKKALKHIDINIACSEQVKLSFDELFNVSNTTIIHNLIDENRIRFLSGSKEYEDSKKIKLIVVARFHQQKRLDRIIKAYSKLKNYYTLTIVGDGELNDELKDLSKRLNVYDDIIWKGILNNPYPFIKDSDLFVMCSEYEGYPTITIESLICTTPILSTNVAGIKEQITTKEYGFIVDNNDDAIYNELDKLKNSKHLFFKLKTLLKEYHYNNEELLSQIENLF